LKEENKMHIAKFLGTARDGEQELSGALLMLSDRYQREAEMRDQCKVFAAWSRSHVEMLKPLIERYGEDSSADPDRLHGVLFHGARVGGVGLVRDLQDASALATHVRLAWTALYQSARVIHDKDLEDVANRCGLEVDRQIAWFCTLLKHASPQALTVPAEKESELPASLVKPPVPPGLPEAVWGPGAVAISMLTVGLIGFLAGQPWLIPSLGPTAYLQAENPGQPTSRFYNTVVGHLVGLVAGFAAVAMLDAWNAPAVLTDKQLVLVRVFAAVIAMVLTIGLGPVLRASHPPAAATTLLVALGSLKTLNDAINVMIGVLIVALVGELLRRVRLGEMRFDPKKQAQVRPAPLTSHKV
jgi:hypothetical protein